MPEKEKKREREEQTEEHHQLFTEIEEKLLAEGPYNDQTIVEMENIDKFQSSPPEEKIQRTNDDLEEPDIEEKAQREEEHIKLNGMKAHLVTKTKEGFNDQQVIHEEEREETPPTEKHKERNIESVIEGEKNDQITQQKIKQDQEERESQKETSFAIEEKYTNQKIVWENDTQKKRVAETTIREKLELEREETEKRTLVSELQAFIETRDHFPNILFEYWLTQRGKIEGKKPFLQVDTPSSKETWFIPNRKLQWNPNYAYTYHPGAAQNRGISGAGMIINFFMEEKSTIKSESQHIGRQVVKELRIRGYSGHKSHKKWFRAVYKLKYKENLIDEVLSQVFWQEYKKQPHWKNPANIEKYPVFKKVLNYYEMKESDQSKVEEKKGKNSTQLNKSKMNRYKEELIPRIVLGLKEEGLQLTDPLIIETMRELRKSRVFRDIGFIGRRGEWKIEVDWVGIDAVNEYFDSLTRPIGGFKIWVELITGKEYYSEAGKKLFYSIDLNKTYGVKGLEKYLGRKLIIFNTKNRFGDEIGIDRGVIYKQRCQSAIGFKNQFLERLKLPSSLRKNVQDGIINDFHKKYGKIFDNYKNGSSRRVIYTLKYDCDDLESSWIKKYNKWKHSNLYQFEEKNTQQVIDYFEKFSYSPSLSGEAIDYAITISQVSYTRLKEKVRNKTINSIDEIINTLKDPRSKSAIFTNVYFGTKDVKPPLVVNTRNTNDFKKEIKPDGQVAIVQALFQNDKITESVDNFLSVVMPKNGVYKFKGQSRGKSSTSTVYEDVSAVKNSSGRKLSQYVNILIKNSTERDKIRIIEDYMKSLYSPTDQSIFVLVNITHPDDLILDPSYIPNTVVEGISNYQEGRRLGWIDIGIFSGEGRLSNVSQIYGAVKHVRNGWEGRKNSKKVIPEVIKKLGQHGVKKVDRIEVQKMNSLFERHDLWKSPREMKNQGFKDFFIDFVETFLLEEKDKRN